MSKKLYEDDKIVVNIIGLRVFDQTKVLSIENKTEHPVRIEFPHSKQNPIYLEGYMEREYLASDAAFIIIGMFSAGQDYVRICSVTC